MRLLLFFFVNVLVAAICGVLTFLQGHDVGTIVLRVVVVLISLQLAYVVWLFAISRLPSNKANERATDRTSNSADEAGIKPATAARTGSNDPGR